MHKQEFVFENNFHPLFRCLNIHVLFGICKVGASVAEQHSMYLALLHVVFLASGVNLEIR